MGNFLKKQWFLISLFVAMAIGFWLANELKSLSDSFAIRYSIVFLVMLAMALPLEFSAFVDVVKKPTAAALACGLNLGAFPLLTAISLAFFDSSTAAGFVVVGATPCTLASAAVWTRRAGGNDAVAIMVTVITNLFCFIVSPAIIWAILGSATQIEPGPLLIRLALLIVLPIGIAQISRLNSNVRQFSANRKPALSLFAQVGILLMVVIGSSKTGQGFLAGEMSFELGSLSIQFLALVVLHLVILFAGYGLAIVLKLGRANAIAVAISGSQKTLMVGLLLCQELQVTILPIVLYHAIQLIIDTIFVNRVRVSD